MSSASDLAAASTRDDDSPSIASFDAPLRHVVTQVFKQNLSSPLVKALDENAINDIHTLLSFTEQDLRGLTWTNDEGELMNLHTSHVRLVTLFKSYVVDQVLPISTLDDDNEWLTIHASDFNLYRIRGPTPSIGSAQPAPTPTLTVTNAL